VNPLANSSLSPLAVVAHAAHVEFTHSRAASRLPSMSGVKSSNRSALRIPAVHRDELHGPSAGSQSSNSQSWQSWQSTPLMLQLLLHVAPPPTVCRKRASASTMSPYESMIFCSAHLAWLKRVSVPPQLGAPVPVVFPIDPDTSKMITTYGLRTSPLCARAGADMAAVRSSVKADK
jgi:hypothetical protein